ncbi:MAG: hypothetical protein H6Q00_3187 [Holophagaceae bacterium]|nr:hypothetical protein [Holophagaceae bacterium]
MVRTSPRPRRLRFAEAVGFASRVPGGPRPSGAQARLLGAARPEPGRDRLRRLGASPRHSFFHFFSSFGFSSVPSLFNLRALCVDSFQLGEDA